MIPAIFFILNYLPCPCLLLVWQQRRWFERRSRCANDVTRLFLSCDTVKAPLVLNLNLTPEPLPDSTAECIGRPPGKIETRTLE